MRSCRSRNKFTHRRRVVAFAVQGGGFPSHRAYPRAIAGAIEFGKTHDWEMVDLDHWYFKIPAFLKPDGLITCLGYSSVTLALELHRAVPKSVHIDSDFLKDIAPGVIRDGPACGLRAAEYMLERGFRNFAISGFSRTRWDPTLLEFERKVQAEGANCARIPSLNAFLKDLSLKEAFFNQQLAKLKLPLSIFCISDRLAVRVCRWCLEAGLQIPEQVAVLGVGNDILACECSPVPISSVDLQCEHRGAEAARLLQRMMDGEPVPDGPLLIPPGDVVTRRSTDILAIPDLASARSLRYIYDHFMENIGAAQVAAACGIPRRTLDRHFASALGHTVNDELIRHRLMRACEFLLTTEMKAAEIASNSGFHTPQYFSRCFKRSLGVTPKVYRERERAKGRTSLPKII